MPFLINICQEFFCFRNALESGKLQTYEGHFG